MMMVVGGSEHTGSFYKEMSKCVSLHASVSVSVRLSLALRGHGADVMSVCVFDALFGQACRPLCWLCGFEAWGM